MNETVSNLPSSTSNRDLEDLFRPKGDVDPVRVLTTQYGGHPLASGYAEMIGQSAEDPLAEPHG